MNTKPSPAAHVVFLSAALRIGAAALAVLAAPGTSISAEEAPAAQKRAAVQSVMPASATSRGAEPVKDAAPVAEPKPLEASIEAGVDYLLKSQQEGGGWGQGGGWRQQAITTGRGGRVEGKDVEDPADLGNTCVGLMALLRTGQTPIGGKHQDAAKRAFEFICRQVEKAEDDSLYVTPVRDTQLQSKIGQYVDTFLAGWVLSELKGNVPEGEPEKRRAAALDKVIAKIEKNQKDNGGFDGNAGWASVLSQGLCSKALNRAARAGARVSAEALAKDQKQNEMGLDVAKGSFSAPAAAEPSSAGIALYREASKLGGLWEKNVTNAKARGGAEAILADAAAPAPAKAQARQELDRIQKEDQAAQVAAQAVTSKLADSKFVAGFGNNGGEEYLSYLTLAEALHAKGGKEWEDWKTKASLTIRTAQNADGGWSGHHCITGRNFCTGTALLVLTVGRDAGKGVAVESGKPEEKTAAVSEAPKAETVVAKEIGQ